jgi:hypothetical protein
MTNENNLITDENTSSGGYYSILVIMVAPIKATCDE